MSNVAVSLNKETVKALKERLASARKGLQTDSPVMRQVAVFLDQWVQRNFQSSGKNVGGWEPFKYGGRIRYSGKGKGKKIDTSAKLLMDSGALRLSFLPFIRKGIAGIGSDLPYAEHHDQGTSKLPQRRILPVNDEVGLDVLHILENFVAVTVRNAR